MYVLVNAETGVEIESFETKQEMVEFLHELPEDHNTPFSIRWEDR